MCVLTHCLHIRALFAHTDVSCCMCLHAFVLVPCGILAVSPVRLQCCYSLPMAGACATFSTPLSLYTNATTDTSSGT